MFEIGDKVDYQDPKTGEWQFFGTISQIGEDKSFFLPGCYKVKIEAPQENENPVGEESFFWYGSEKLRKSEVSA